MRDDRFAQCFFNGGFDASTSSPAQQIVHRFIGQTFRTLKGGDAAEALAQSRDDILFIHAGEGHVTSNPANSDLSDNPKPRRRQRSGTENPVGLRINAELGERTQAWLAHKSGISVTTISDYVRNGIASTGPAIKIAAALGRSVDWLLLGSDGNPDAPMAEDEASNTVAVQEIDLAYGLGGTYSDGPVEVQTHRFPRAWIEAITSSPPSALIIARGRGDSMQPTLQDGDMVMIDRSERTVREQDVIWAMTVGDIAMIKRVRVRGAQVTVLSDNDRIPPDEYHHEEINVVGRVIFIGRRI